MFPRTAPPDWSRARPGAPARSESLFGPSRAVGRPTILAVDDEPETLDFLEAFLGSEGFDLVTALSGAEALELAEKRTPALVIVDFMMPGMTGLELCEQLRERRETKDVPIVLYSAYDVHRHSNTGLYDCAFVKPADPDELLGAIRALTAQPS